VPIRIAAGTLGNFDVILDGDPLAGTFIVDPRGHPIRLLLQAGMISVVAQVPSLNDLGLTLLIALVTLTAIMALRLNAIRKPV